METNTIINQTKGQWIYSKYSTDFGIYSTEGNGNDIALVREYGNGKESEANAKLIVESVNNHEKLVKALSGLVDFSKWIPADTFTESGLKDFKSQLKAAGELLNSLNQY